MTEIFALHQQIDGEDDDDAEGSDGAEVTHENFGSGLELSAVGVDDADWLDGGRGLWGVGRLGVAAFENVSADVFDSRGGAFKGLDRGGMDGGDFILDVGPILGKAAGDVEELAGDDVSDCADDGEGEDACNCDCEDARDAAGLKAADGGGQQKREREGEGEGDEKLAGEVQDQDGDREHEKGADPGQLGASRRRHRTSGSLMDGVACPGKNTSRQRSLSDDGR
jgi:hypothetical protein